MSTKEISAAAQVIKELHLDAKRYLHERTELTEAGLIARVAYLMGEMAAPIKTLVALCPPEAAPE